VWSSNKGGGEFANVAFGMVINLLRIVISYI
jgi:hypothetical protein